MASYVARIEAADDYLLAGETKVSESPRFETFAQAYDWLQQGIAASQQANCQLLRLAVDTRVSDPEIKLSEEST